jgi:hypothetical protein
LIVQISTGTSTTSNRSKSKVAGGFCGELIAYYVYPPGECDGMTIIEMAEEDTARAVALYVQSAGAVSTQNVAP